MNGFTWSAKGDLVPVCCRNAVCNTSPHVRPSRCRYITRHDDPSREKERERRSHPPLNYLVGVDQVGVLLFILSNDPDKPTIKTRRGSVARVDSPTICIYRGSKRPRRWPRLDARPRSHRERWLLMMMVAGAPTTDICRPIDDIAPAIISRAMYRAFRIPSVSWTTREIEKMNESCIIKSTGR